jgi:hypothetical protein
MGTLVPLLNNSPIPSQKKKKKKAFGHCCVIGFSTPKNQFYFGKLKFTILIEKIKTNGMDKIIDTPRASTWLHSFWPR